MKHRKGITCPTCGRTVKQSTRCFVAQNPCSECREKGENMNDQHYISVDPLAVGCKLKVGTAWYGTGNISFTVKDNDEQLAIAISHANALKLAEWLYLESNAKYVGEVKMVLVATEELESMRSELALRPPKSVYVNGEKCDYVDPEELAELRKFYKDMGELLMTHEMVDCKELELLNKLKPYANGVYGKELVDCRELAKLREDAAVYRAISETQVLVEKEELALLRKIAARSWGIDINAQR